MKRFLVFILIAGGAIVLSYPIISNLLVTWNQTSVIEGNGRTVQEMNEEEKQNEWLLAQQYNDQLSGAGIEDPFMPDSGYVLPKEYLSVLDVGDMIGVIEIPKINVKLPIYHGTSAETLEKGVGHLQNTAFPIGGEGNHSILTGHRGLSTAQLFTDLDKLEKGDQFYITVLDQTLAYKVNQIVVVEPSDTKELMPVAGKDYITLVTCTPLGVNSHRLLVRAERTEYQEQDLKTQSWYENPITWYLAIGSAIIILLILLLVRRRKKKRNETQTQN